jgi:para-aminobenzoate synthetase component 1
MDSSILIRTLLSTQEQLFCWGGSGVVADSVMAQEYQECLDKVSALMNLPLA